MKDKVFVDSNIWLYLFGNDAAKKQVALKFLSQDCYISTQIVAENINVCIRKFKLTAPEVEQHAKNLISLCQVTLIHPSTIELALKISSRHQYSFYDSLVLASALETDCRILYSEDLQDGQVIEGKLKIVNPFIATV